MKTLSLRPYPRTVLVCESREEFKKAHFRVFKNDEHGLKDSNRGRMVGLYNDKNRTVVYLVFFEDVPSLVHELTHVVFSVLETASIPINGATDEAFCYLLQQLVADAL